ncbi:NAD-dependent epimerase/dehydratase family protein [Alteromonas sp. ASW11-130]|uniref:NAD-dependent epimerase/dehydratase family protein n=1 Tax=Alteromonas sp. ASW11-130 TaxID=3015775 RepID=UPI0022425BBB|nr:NAD-dependent epimerase/dehydratase family protein [Alteromonas sp. ASW11-130]MCW8092677.1 NAD-dependent epimerase/dehydratase family protein [Alteromonas sp. ASW11-130]
MTDKITLCGCGWLGNYVLQELVSEYSILGTTRDAKRAGLIKEKGGSALYFELGNDPSELCQRSKNATVILNIPPGRRNQNLTQYTQRMCALIDSFVAHNARQIIFISTTSVYGEHERTVTENAELMPQTESAKAHGAIETYLLQRAGDVATVVRLAGLVGPDRHPAKSLAGKRLSQAHRVVNLIHIEDIIRALKKLIGLPPSGKTLHLCCLDHPGRKEYYSFCAEKLNLPLPIFDDQEAGLSGKQIDATASWQYLGLTPRYASPFDMISGN